MFYAIYFCLIGYSSESLTHIYFMSHLSGSFTHSYDEHDIEEEEEGKKRNFP